MIGPASLRSARLGRVARTLAVAAGLAVVLASAPLGVFAHANLTQSSPAVDQALPTAPDRVRLAFSEAVDPAGTGLAVLDGSGAQVDQGDQAIGSTEHQASVGLGPLGLGQGVYTVAWSSRSVEDGHDAKGFFAFAVGAPNAAPVLSIQGPGAADPGLATAGELAVRLSANPAAGPHLFEVAVGNGGQPVADAQIVRLRLTPPGLDLGRSDVVAASQGDGRYLATTWLPSLPGAWQAEVMVRRSGLDDVSATFTIQVGP